MMQGTIISVERNTYPTTVIYERNGKRYRGAQWNHLGPEGEAVPYYFGGAAHLPNLSDIDAAWEQGFPKEPH